MNAPFDIAIIGAGIAGLAAGRRLAGAGRRVAILEARDRVGGRIYTHRAAPGIPIELGAEFVHGRPPALCTLIREAGLPTYELEGSELRYEGGRLSARSDLPSHAHHVLEGMMQWLEQRPAGTDMTFEQYLESTAPAPEAAEAAAYYVEGSTPPTGTASASRRLPSSSVRRMLSKAAGCSASPRDMTRFLNIWPPSSLGRAERSGCKRRFAESSGAAGRSPCWRAPQGERTGKFMPGAPSSPFPSASCRRAAFNSSRGLPKSCVKRIDWPWARPCGSCSCSAASSGPTT